MGSQLVRIAGGILASGAFVCAPVQGADRQPTSLAVRVVVCDAVGVDRGVLAGAQRTASKVYARIGVDIVWLDRVASASEPTAEAGMAAIETPVLYVRFIPHSQLPARQVNASAVGYSRTVGRIASVAYERVAELARIEHQDVSALLGYVVAHEIGHILLRARPHSSEGLMRATIDHRLGGQGLLWFNPEEALAVRARLAEVGGALARQ